MAMSTTPVGRLLISLIWSHAGYINRAKTLLLQLGLLFLLLFEDLIRISHEGNWTLFKKSDIYCRLATSANDPAQLKTGTRFRWYVIP